MMMTVQPGLTALMRSLRRSHHRLEAVLSPMTDEQVTGPSYDSDWTIAQVASHLGSGAQVFDLFLDAGRRHVDAPGVEQFGPIWDRWNAEPPADQARDALAADAQFLDAVDALTPTEQAGWQLDMFGTQQTLAGLLRMRLAEHALHVWDIDVTRDATVTLSTEATGFILDSLPSLVERAGRPLPRAVRVAVTTTGPDRLMVLAVSADGARLQDGHPPASVSDRSLRLPAEAFVRLVYGRLDPDHTPSSITADDEGLLDTLRAVFPGV